MWRRFAVACSILAITGVACVRLAEASPSYTATDLGVLYSSTSESAIPTGINNAGQISGTSIYDSSGDVHAFRWASGTMTNLGDASQNSSVPGNSWGNGIDTAGMVVGYTSIYGTPYYHLMVNTTTPVDLNYQVTGLSGGLYCWGTGISPSGADIANR